MDKLEKELTELLGNESGFTGSIDESTRKEIAQMISHKFESDMSKVKIVFWIFLFVSVAMMVGGMIFLTHEKGTRGMLFAVVVALIGYNSTILMKLWYWVVSTKLGILKEIKQLQLQIAELTDKKPPPEN
jgi:hypothetical protein